MSSTRRNSISLAVLLNFPGLGLGYVYLGRMRYALSLAGSVIGIVAVAGWSGAVFEPGLLYALAGIAAILALFPFVHCAILARREREVVKKSYNRVWFYMIWILASWVLTDAIIATRPVLFGFEPFHVPSASMSQAVERGDFVMTDTWAYEDKELAYGDLVVFGLPQDPDVKYMKRVLGLPGDRVRIADDVLYRNEDAIDEPYIYLERPGNDMTSQFSEMTVPTDHFFVLGDNRHNSRDSRFIGPIPMALLHGKVVHRWFAFDEGIEWDRFPTMLDGD